MHIQYYVKVIYIYKDMHIYYYVNYYYYTFQHVKVSHRTSEVDDNFSSLLLSGLPPLGPDGKPMKTSVCDEIKESVDKAAEIERKLEKVIIFN